MRAWAVQSGASLVLVLACWASPVPRAGSILSRSACSLVMSPRAPARTRLAETGPLLSSEAEELDVESRVTMMPMAMTTATEPMTATSFHRPRITW
ncbi:MAG: hypothetical protein JO148_14100 [Acidimicrobiia bacterium]|nr:hypothetical protein [Acidimicrobiia bacterium]